MKHTIPHSKFIKIFLLRCTQDGSIAAAQRLPLRQEFVHSLCIADQLGVLRSIEHIAQERSHRAGPSPSSVATVEESLQTVNLTGSTSPEEESQKLKDSEPKNLTEDDASQKDTACKDESCTSGSNEKLKSSDSKSETVDSKTKAAATGVGIDSRSKTSTLRYYGAGVGSFLT